MTQAIKKIIITGTHLTPAIELIRQLKSDSKNNWEIYYIGRESNSNDIQQSAIESKVIPSLGVEFYSIPCGKFDRRYLPNTILGTPKTISGVFKSFFLVKKIKPNIVVSFGGYVSVPVIISSWLLKIKSITHEQTLTNSLTTKINSRFVTKVALTFENQKQINQLPKNKDTITGNLLRYELFQKPKNPKLITNKLLANKPIIYVTAGNQGSHAVNLVLKQILPKLSYFNIIHQTGTNDYPKFKLLTNKYKNYFASDYFTTQDFAWIIQHSDIFISRSGANTTQEIIAFNKKSVLIPLPKSQQGEQLLNALFVKKELPQQTIIIDQNNLTSKSLLESLDILKNVKKTSNSKDYQPNQKLLSLINEII